MKRFRCRKKLADRFIGHFLSYFDPSFVNFDAIAISSYNNYFFSCRIIIIITKVIINRVAGKRNSSLQHQQ